MPYKGEDLKERDELPFQELNDLLLLVNRPEWSGFLALMKKHRDYCYEQALLYIEQKNEIEAYAFKKCGDRATLIMDLVKRRIQELRKEGE